VHTPVRNRGMSGRWAEHVEWTSCRPEARPTGQTLTMAPVRWCREPSTSSDFGDDFRHLGLREGPQCLGADVTPLADGQ